MLFSKKIKILFLPNVNETSGAGHFFRCLSIAKALKNYSNCFFNFESKEFFFKKIIKQNDMFFCKKKIIEYTDNEFSTAIIDNYKIKQTEINILKKKSNKIILINDFKNKLKDLDLVIYPSNFRSYKKKKVLSGVEYSIVRNDFNEAKYTLKKKVKNIILSFGYVDSKAVVLDILKYLIDMNLKTKYNFSIIIGSKFKQKKKLKELISKSSLSVDLIEDCTNMLDVLLNTDLVIGSGGVSLLERSGLGVPSITFQVSENQKNQVNFFAKKQATIKFIHKKNSFKKFKEIFSSITADYYLRRTLSKNSKKIIDGNGLKKIASNILNLNKFENNA